MKVAPMNPTDTHLDLLVVDDEPEVRSVLIEYFGGHGLRVREAPDAAAARALVAEGVPCVAILDIHMPGEDGLSLARWLREHFPLLGIIFLTADGDPVDRVVGLEVGGDDYVPKPFQLRELLARVKSLMRRLAAIASTAAQAAPPAAQEPAMPLPRRVAFGDCQLDLDEHRLLDARQQDIPITTAEFDLLALFARSPRRPLTRDQIMAQAHNRDWEAYDRSIDLRVMRLRRKIERNPDKPEIIKTVRNLGYVFLPAPPKE
jgi:two-component system phosphate regulon response regulator OmpR